MTKYKLQYWIYAILNKQFGTEVKFDRCSLHRIYEVNRHSFEVSTNNLSIKVVNSFLIQKLKEAGYVQKDNGYSKLDDNKEYFIHLDIQPRGNGFVNRDKPVLSMSIHSFSRKMFGI